MQYGSDAFDCVQSMNAERKCVRPSSVKHATCGRFSAPVMLYDQYGTVKSHASGRSSSVNEPNRTSATRPPSACRSRTSDCPSSWKRRRARESTPPAASVNVPA